MRGLIYQRAGISLADSKQEMVYSRLARRLRATGIDSLRALPRRPRSRAACRHEWEAFTNALTTNLTSFFREAHHFPLLAEHALKARASTGAPLTIWCSASSTGEEPYSIAMTAVRSLRHARRRRCQIIATDIDTNVLATASAGVYPLERVDKLDAERLRRFFLKGKGAQEGLVRVRPELRKLITFRQLNLLADGWDVQGPVRRDLLPQRDDLLRQGHPAQDPVALRAADEAGRPAVRRATPRTSCTSPTRCTLRGKTVYELQPALTPRPPSIMDTNSHFATNVYYDRTFDMRRGQDPAGRVLLHRARTC